MSDNHVVVALDIGTTKICAVVGEVEASGALHVVGTGQSPSCGLRKGVVVDIPAVTRSIRAAIELASHNTGIEIASVVVGVTGDHVSGLTCRGVTTITHVTREISEQDVQRALESARVAQLPPGRDVLHVIPRYFTVDGQAGVRQPVGMAASRLEVETHVITGSANCLQNVYKSVEAAGLVVDLVVLEPVATCEAVLTPSEKEIGALVADIGGGTTDVAVVQDGAIVHSFIIPVGGSHVTNDLAIGLKTGRGEAERLKLEYGCAMPHLVDANEILEIRGEEGTPPRPLTRGAIADIIEPRMNELFRLIKTELAAKGLDRTLTGAVLSGGGSLLQGSCELAAQVLGLPVRVGSPRLEEKLGLNTPVYATAVGLLQHAAARQSREREEVSSQHFLARALEQLRAWLSRVFSA